MERWQCRNSVFGQEREKEREKEAHPQIEGAREGVLFQLVLRFTRDFDSEVRKEEREKKN